MRKRSIAIKGHRTSIALEPVFWAALEKIAEQDALTLPALIAEIDRRRLTRSPAPGLSSALRVFAFERLSGVRDET